MAQGCDGRAFLAFVVAKQHHPTQILEWDGVDAGVVTTSRARSAEREGAHGPFIGALSAVHHGAAHAGEVARRCLVNADDGGTDRHPDRRVTYRQ